MSTHLDILGQELQPGDTVAYRVYDWLEIGRITKITAKRIKVRRVGATANYPDNHVLPDNMVKLESPAAMMYVLKNSR